MKRRNEKYWMRDSNMHECVQQSVRRYLTAKSYEFFAPEPG